MCGEAPVLEGAEEHSDFEQTFESYVDPIYRFLYSRLGNREDAEDLASEVFLKASHGLDVSRSDAAIGRWLFTVARTVLADHWRRYYRYGALLPFEETTAGGIPDSPEIRPHENEAERHVAEILDALPERYRQVLQLRFLNGLSVRETAQALGITSGNVKVLQHRALARAVRVGSDLLPTMSRRAEETG